MHWRANSFYWKSKHAITDYCKNGWERSSAAYGRLRGSLCRQAMRKLLRLSESWSGTSGISSLWAIFIKEALWFSKSYWLHGVFPVAISNTVHPRAQVSALRPNLLSFITSGAIQGTLPFIASLSIPFSDVSVLSISLEHPKSDSLTLPLLSIKIFDPLRSLCMTLFWWRYSNPCKICLV